DPVAELRARRTLARPPPRGEMDPPEHRQGRARSRGASARMGRALLDWRQLRRSAAADLRSRVGALAFTPAGARRRDRNGRGAALRAAAGAGSRDRFLEDPDAALQLPEERG